MLLSISASKSPHRTPRSRSPLLAGVLWLAVVTFAGCGPEGDLSRIEKIWGEYGIRDGRFLKPRGIAIDRDDRLYIVDMTAHIQVFDREGTFLRGWRTPVHDNGRPTGISIGRDGRVLVPDTHYYRVLIYSPTGELQQTIGGTQGSGPGEFGFVTDVAEDSQGNYYVSEYGEHDRIQKFTGDGEYVLEWGTHGSELGNFVRPQTILFDEEDRLWVADACNHRIQVFDTEGKLLFSWGTEGTAPGQLRYPYSLVFDRDKTLYICEYGNHRVQRFTRDGQSLGCWGTQGRGPAQMHNPWAVVIDREGALHVLDTNNHRVQRIRW